MNTIKKTILNRLKDLRNFGLEDELQQIIINYYHSIKETPKGLILKFRFMEQQNYWKCIKELKKAQIYYGQANFYRLIDDIINDIAVRACYKKIICPFDEEEVKDEDKN